MRAERLPKPPKYIYDPIEKVSKPNPLYRKARKPRSGKHSRNLLGCYPGYVFTINGQEYICTDADEIPRSINPIPIRIYPTPPSEYKVMLKPIVPPYPY